jgi:SSS family transporter
MPALIAISLYMILQFGIGIWVARRVRTESDYILAGRQLGYGLLTFSTFATWFGAETIIGSAGRAYRDGVSLGSAEPFGYGLCLILMGVIFAGPLWRRGLTTLADLFRERFSARAERLAAVLLIPGSILWGAAQIRGFSYVISTSSDGMSGELAIMIAAGFTILYTVVGGMLADAMNDLIQGIMLAVGLVIVLIAVLPHVGDIGEATRRLVDESRLRLFPGEGNALSIVERWMIPVAGSVIATELVGRVLAARSAKVAQRSSIAAGGMYWLFGSIPLVIGLVGPQLAPSLADGEQLLPHLASTIMPKAVYVVFAGALVSAILSTVNSTLLVASAILSHNVIVPMLRITDDCTKVRLARAGVTLFGVIAYFLARDASGVFELVEEASAFGSAGVVVTVTFGLFSNWGGARTAIATLATGVVTYLAANAVGSGIPFLISLVASLGCYLVGAVWERQPVTA